MNRFLSLITSPVRAAFPLLVLCGLSSGAAAGSFLTLDFNAAGPGAAKIEVRGSPDSQAQAALDASGAIDTFRGEPSGAALLKAGPFSGPGTWSAEMRTSRLPATNTEGARNKITLAFDLSPSQTKAVRVTLSSFDAEGKRGGSLTKLVYPPVAGSFYRHRLHLGEMAEGEGMFDATAPYFQLSWEIGNGGGLSWDGSSAATLRIDNATLSAPSYYVSQNGSDKADGRTEATAFLTIERGVKAAEAGDDVLVLAGDYNVKGINLAKSGAPAKWITLKAAPGAKPRIAFDGWGAFTLKNGAAYTELSGLEICGNARNVTLAAAEENGRAEKPDGKFNGSAISVEGRTTDSNGSIVKDESEHRDRADRPHHLRITNCDIHDACGAGIAVILADYVTVEGNRVTDCAVRSRYAHSGITLYWAWNFDGSTQHRNFVRNNVAARNRTLVAWLPRWETDPSKAHVSDGNGIIIDDFIQHQPGSPQEPNVGRTLVQNNLSHHNGGGGVHIFASDRVDVVNNTAYENCQTPIIDYGEIDTSWSKDCRVFNNIGVASAGKSVLRNRNRQYKFEPSNQWQSNILFADGSRKVQDFSEKDIWGDPMLAAPEPNARDAAFSVRRESPALGFGIQSDLVSGLDLLGRKRGAGSAVTCGAIEAAAEEHEPAR